GGRLFDSRRAILDAVRASRFLVLEPPAGAMYAFVRVRTGTLAEFDDQQFALDLLEQQHVLVAPGVSFNVPYRDHFRVTNLPDAGILRQVFARIETLLAAYANAPRALPADNVVAARDRFK
ncbi:MAG: aminotransferase class I/II-fold pyridoxal phosphate-dependent enzyme, partial [Steroidobacteraceae bacterium]